MGTEAELETERSKAQVPSKSGTKSGTKSGAKSESKFGGVSTTDDEGGMLIVKYIVYVATLDI